ncbi:MULTISPECIES: sialate O-acetylesterase [unclassified Fibrobacter]|uniref:sialate O-acetylesterase n=1 Tax=unclassified Fibrobacter TaxID=2634177 RepID=UPI000D7B76D2|nr:MULTISPECIES: sialate O-acetylesterase [unclassified Fibrobacter]PWJ61488.1 carbohydrate binding protein with CBM6 domain [Fibrobacter sp. UWR4]PZW67304.1 carbohydrate binding protein with CBM6 domain [Fibrobacter sp. UWR1]
MNLFHKFAGAACCVFGLTMLAPQAEAAPNPNFHIYIAYGQSNMAGAGPIQTGDQDPVDNFVMISGVDCNSRKGGTNIKLAKGQWSKAVPPMFHCQEGLSVADYFGKTMAKEMPNVTIGIIPVAVGGASIKLFDKAQWQSYVNSSESWLANWAKDYDSQGNDYAAIINLAKKAQEVGVIKGFIFHQGETDGGMGNWEQVVQKTYNDMRNDLGIKEELPFVAGEMVYNGACHGMSTRVNGLSKYFAKFGVAKSQGTGMQGDRLHFDHDGYVEMGKRYAQEMLKLIDKTVDPDAPAVQVPLYGGGSAGSEKPEEYGPYGDVFKIPGKVQAEDYNKGGSGVAYSDMDSKNQGDEYRGDGVDIYKAGMGMAVGYCQKGEWMKYSVHVEEDGEYEMIGRLAGDNGTGAIAVYLGDDKIGETMVSEKGPDYDTYSDVSGGKVTLKKGDYDLKIQIEVDWVNIDYVEFKKAEAEVVEPDPENPVPSDTTVKDTLPVVCEGSECFEPIGIRAGVLANRVEDMSKAQYFDMAGNRIGKASALKQGAYLVRIPGVKTFVVRNEK